MEETYDRDRYVLVARLPRPLEVRIEDIFLSITGATKPVMGYHVTVLGPFHLVESVDYASLTLVSQVCQQWNPFAVHLAGLSAFQVKDDNAVYLRVVECNDIILLHYDLLEATDRQVVMQNERTRHWNVEDYEPHVTLGLRLSDRELEAFLHAAAEHDLRDSFEVSSLWLAEQRPNGPWQYVAEFPLSTGEEEVLSPESRSQG